MAKGSTPARLVPQKISPSKPSPKGGSAPAGTKKGTGAPPKRLVK